MNLRTIPRATVTGYLRAARLPLDATFRLLPAGDTGRVTAARLAVDRIDATLRAVAGSVLGDPVLRDDAVRRRRAAEERRRALRLRTEAERTSERAEEGWAEHQEQIEQRLRRADERAGAVRRSAERGREQKARRAAETASSRRRSNRETARRKREAVEERAREARLETLDTKAEALAEREEALIASDEARRLQRAAGKAKAARKDGAG